MPIFGSSLGSSLFINTGATTATSLLWCNSATTHTATTAGWYQDVYQEVLAQAQTMTTAQAYNSSSTWWEENVTPTQYYGLAQQRAQVSSAEIERRQAEAQRRQAEAQRAYEQVQAERAKAEARAREFLLAHLTKAQQQCFIDNHWFIVDGGKTQTPYRIRKGFAGNIDVLDKSRKKATAVLCCHCSADIPVYDNMLAQKITLQFDEERFLQIANRRAA